MMKEILILGSQEYENSETTNYGDCILINTGSKLFIYDCGHETHADKVISYMDKHGYEKATLILSHNDKDHFEGIRKLLSENKISVIKTTLLLKYVDDILDKINDQRRKREPLKQQILNLYNNIAELSGEPIEDIYEHPETFCSEVSIIGPDLDYMMNAVAKHLDSRESDNIDGETIYNATSIQVKIKFGASSMLLCGDCSYASIENIVRSYDAIQLPHHGKPKQAEQIFEKKSDQINSFYVISDNTGNTNGGSDKLDTTGYRVYNTKYEGTITINNSNFLPKTVQTGRTLGM